jgi:nicotinamide riboside kinase
VKDELREYPDDKNRVELFHIYKDLLVHQSTPWHVVSGSHEERMQQAIVSVKSIISANDIQ